MFASCPWGAAAPCCLPCSHCFFLVRNLRASTCFFFFLNDPAPPEISPFPLPDPLPIPRLRAQQPVGSSSGELGHLVGAGAVAEGEHGLDAELAPLLEQRPAGQAGAAPAQLGEHRRSEEHTSELQSRLHLVCRLLLEKKK